MKQGGLAVVTKGGNRQVMRNGQNNKRMRGRSNNNNNNNNNRKSQNPMTRVFESNGPDLKIRGTPSHIAEKYLQLARDAQSSGDPVAAENYFQHAEHYFRLIAAAQEQYRQSNPQFYRPENETRDTRDDSFDDGDETAGQMGQPSISGAGEAPFGTREPQPYLPREPQQQPPYPAREQHGYAPRPQPPAPPPEVDVDRLPSFITGGQQPQPQAQPAQNQQSFGPNGHDNQGDRFPLHRRRRRHRGPRHELQGSPQGGEGDDASHGNE
jgi:Domain of unknown function (DUF4167)